VGESELVMTWRTVCVTEPAKLELKLGYLVVRGEAVARVSLSEIGMLIVESTQVAITSALLCELSKRKIKVIFCDQQHNPYAELVDYYGSADSLRRLREQLAWSKELCQKLWREIVKEKISQQAALLKEKGHFEENNMLLEYRSKVVENDATNREAHAAKVYFNCLFGDEFSRKDDSIENAALNYGYSLLLSCFNKEIVSRGYLTQLGLHHQNTFNQFNFSSDLMEPFRPLVDRWVLVNKFDQFNKEEKHIMLGILNSIVELGGTKQNLTQAINLYCSSVFRALNHADPLLIEFYQCVDS
jgi:CRISPR-associated endonuclease Cas1 subtype II